MARFPLIARITERAAGRRLACPDEITLAAFADGTLSPDARKRTEEHLLRCDDCLEASSLLVKLQRVGAAVTVPPAALARVRDLQPAPRLPWMIPAIATIAAALL